jgi:predicted DNA-binding transcriptional regulator AlpA
MIRRDPRVPDERLIDAHELLNVIPIHRATLNAWIRAGRFPAPLKLSPSKRFWRWSTIVAWLDLREKQNATRPTARRSSKKRHR